MDLRIINLETSIHRERRLLERFLTDRSSAGRTRPGRRHCSEHTPLATVGVAEHFPSTPLNRLSGFEVPLSRRARLRLPMTLFLLVSAAILGGTAFVLNELDNAPEGYQTEEGFNIVWKNNSPDKEDISCVWTPAHSRVG
jgi:hypothetical protein